MSPHTPGPRAQFIDRSAGTIDIVPAMRKGLIATVNLEGSGDADAHLIGAAPDMLAALRMFVAAEDAWNARDGRFDDPLTDAYHAARAAIAKAEGLADD